MITVEKEVYEAVLRNSVRVNDLEAENHKLKEINLCHSEKLCDCEKEKQRLKELLKECREWIEFMEEKCRADENYKGTMYFKNLVKNIDEAIGEKK